MGQLYSMLNQAIEYLCWLHAQTEDYGSMTHEAIGWGYRSVRYSDCAGFKLCNKDQCIFYIHFGERNHCAGSPQHINCNARKYTGFYLRHRSWYILSWRTCMQSKEQQINQTSIIVNDALAVNLTLTPSQMQSNCVISALSSRASWNDVDVLIEESASLKKISNEKNKVEKSSATKRWYQSRG